MSWYRNSSGFNSGLWPGKKNRGIWSRWTFSQGFNVRARVTNQPVRETLKDALCERLKPAKMGQFYSQNGLREGSNLVPCRVKTRLKTLAKEEEKEN